MKQMWVWIKGVMGKQAGEADTGMEQNSKMVCNSKGKRRVR